ncbi:MAG: lipopolysaccharide biosynthesis protein [Fibrobacteres bacterium]|nr:lipopolysaccharide biosynthesis protein [Fibrobacterota bacterium]
MNSLKQKTISGVIWSAVEKFSVQFTQLITGIILARLLSPSEFGIVGMVTIFLTISYVFIDSGFSVTLIRKLDRTETDFSTVFCFNVASSILLYLILFALAPYISSFYNQQILTPIVRVVALNLVINSLTVIQRVQFAIKVDFKIQAKVSFLAAIISGLVGVLAAHGGYGVWSLIIQTITNSIICCIMFWTLSSWKPISKFSFRAFKELFSSGSKFLASSLIYTASRNSYAALIGKVFTPADLGYYTRADQFSQFPSSNITSIMVRVTLPILSTLQNDVQKLSHVYRQYLKLSAYVVFPLMVGLAAVSRPFIVLSIGEKWIEVVPLLQILCFVMMWYPIHAINLNLLQIKGRSDLFLKLEIIKNVISITALLASLPFGIKVICITSIFVSLICLYINSYYTEKLIGIGFITQIFDLFPTLCRSMLMGLASWYTVSFFSSVVLQLTMGIAVGVIVYFVLSVVFKSSEFISLVALIKARK